MPGEDLALTSTATLRRRSVGNLLRMGHCAPTVMKTLLDASGSTERWPVMLTAGLPGGIGNTGGECGGLTAPLVLLGLEHGRDETEDGLPVVVEAGHDLLARFADTQGTTQCREIRGTSRVPLRCIGVVREAPVTCAACVGAPVGRGRCAGGPGGIPEAVRALEAARVPLCRRRVVRVRRRRRRPTRN